MLVAISAGDRFIGYDYASKLPLDDFVVDTVVDEQHVPATRSALATPTVKLSLGNSAARAPKAPQRMVVSLPVIDILGRQVHVDAVYHDFLTDTIYVFSGMKFFTFRADEFKVSFPITCPTLSRLFVMREIASDRLVT